MVRATNGAYEHFKVIDGRDAHLIMVEKSLPDVTKFGALAHELTHLADTAATHANIEKLEQCIQRRKDEEIKPDPNNPGGGGLCFGTGCGGGSEPGGTVIHGYCEYERRIYCDTDDEGNNTTPCYIYWVLIDCVITHVT